MKKRMLALLMCLCMLLSLMLSGCGVASRLREQIEGGKEMIEQMKPVEEEADDSGKGKVQIEGGKESGSAKVSSPKAVSVNAEDFDVTSYLYEDDYSSICFLVITNNSEAAVTIKADGTALDEAGSKLGVSSTYLDVLGPGETSMAYIYFSDVHNVDSVEYSLEYEQCRDYLPVISNLTIEEYQNEENVVVSARNDGDTCVEFLQAYALFFDADNNVIAHSSTYLLDCQDELKPGKTLAAEMNTFDPYDHAEVYFSGRSTGKKPDANPPVTEDDFELEEYFCPGDFSNDFVVVVTNNSEHAVEARGNVAVKDAEGNLLCANSSGLDILGPGETSAMEFYLTNVDGADSIEYELSYDTDVLYAPVISNLSCEVTANNNNAIVAITNDGTVPAEFVQALALFFDAEGNLVHYGRQYINDDDNEIKPGKTCVEQINVYGQEYDHVDVYLAGRAED